MNILTVNCGSSSLKVRLSAIDAAGAARLLDGRVEEIGPAAVVEIQPAGGAASRSAAAVADHAAALRALLQLAGEAGSPAIDAVGHRVVQGGAYARPTLIDRAVLRAIDAGRRLAPLHNGPSLAGIRAARELLRDVPMVAVFDTTFHTTMPPRASRYALPQDLTLKHGLRRYGYHGIAHRSMVERYGELTRTPRDSIDIITLQLGNGCSATAIARGVSVDTSMGFTPLEGLVMGTRPGDVDPGALAYLLREEHLTAAELDSMLNEASGLLGVSGSTADMAVLLHEERAGHPRAHAAVDLFCYRARKYIGAYLAVLGRAQAVVFGGGIGERAAEVRRRICEPLEPLGLQLDGERNAGLTSDGPISRDGSALAAWVIASDEERVIARDTFDVLSRSGERSEVRT